MGRTSEKWSQIDHRMAQDRGKEKQCSNRKNREKKQRLLLTRSAQEAKEENEKQGQYNIFYNETNISEWIYIPTK